jgi:hypothetical protein
MKVKTLLITVALLLSVAVANADFINYTVTPEVGSAWSGHFNVCSLSAPASDNLGNTLHVFANGSAVPFSFFGSGGNWLAWTDAFENGLYLYSWDLKNTISANDWGTTWSDLAGHTYALDKVDSVNNPVSYSAQFYDPGPLIQESLGGTISFSSNAPTSIPEPSIVFLLPVGGALIWFIRRKSR